MSTLNAIQKTIAAQNKAKAVKVEPNSADTSLVDEREVGVLVSGSNGTTGVYSGSVTVEAGDSGHGRLGGDVTISSGDGFYAGNVYVFGGSNLTEPPHSTFGGIYLYTGGVDKENLLATSTSTTTTGLISIQTGDVSADNITSGQIIIKSGSPHNHTGSISGNITIQSGGTSSTANAGHTGLIEIKTGQGGTDESGSIDLITGRTSTAPSGNVIINTGRTTTATSGTLGLFTGDPSNGGNSGSITMYSGTTNLAGASGSVTIQSGESEEANTGNVTVKSGNLQGGGDSGSLILESGQASTGSSGSVFLKSGSSATVDSGSVYLFSSNAGRNTGALEMRTGISSINGNSGAINLYTGTATNATHSSGAISIYSGQGHTTSGALDLYSGISDLTSGAVSLHSGDATSTVSGAVSIYSGDSTGGNSGAIYIKSGTGGNGITDRSGGITIQTGDSTNQSGTILIKAGASSGSTGGHVQLVTSNVDPASTGPSGGLSFQTGSCAGTLDTGSATLKTGDNTGTGLSGKIDIYTGDADGDSTGDLEIKTGFTPANGFTSGEITIATGGKESAGSPATATSSDLADSGDLTIRTGNTYDGTVGSISIKTGDYSSQVYNTSVGGDITIETGTTTGRADYEINRKITLQGGDHDGDGWDTTTGACGQAGGIALKAGDLRNAGGGTAGSISIIAGNSVGSPISPYTGNYAGSVTIAGGSNTDLDSTSVGSFGDVFIRGGSTYYPTLTTKNESSKVQIRGGDIAFNTADLGGFGSKTKKGGDVEIRGGYVKDESSSSTGHSADDGSGTQDLGEVKIISGSVPTSSVNNRIMTVQADGVLKSSGVQILGQGELYYTPSVSGNVHILPISFTGTRASPSQNTIGSSGADYYQTNIYDSVPRYDAVYEWYEGTPIIDHSTTITGAMSTAADAQSGTPYYKHGANPWASDVSTEVSTSVGIDYHTARKLRILVSYIYGNANPDSWRTNRQYTYGTPMLSPSVGLLHEGLSSGGVVGWTCELIWRTPGLSVSGGPGIYNFLTGAGSTVRISYLVYQVD